MHPARFSAVLGLAAPRGDPARLVRAIENSSSGHEEKGGKARKEKGSFSEGGVQAVGVVLDAELAADGKLAAALVPEVEAAKVVERAGRLRERHRRLEGTEGEQSVMGTRSSVDWSRN